MSEKRKRTELREGRARAELAEIEARLEIALTAAAKSRMERRFIWLDAIGDRLVKFGNVVKWLCLPLTAYLLANTSWKGGQWLAKISAALETFSLC